MYKILDDRGSILHTEANAALAIVWLQNNDDIAVSIDPKPSTEELANYEVVLRDLSAERDAALEAKKATTAPTAAPETANSRATAPQATTLLNAQEAREAIRRKNEATYDKQILKLIEKVIAGDGEYVGVELNKYIVTKLTELGYYVSSSRNGHRISVNELIIVPTQAVSKAKEETSELLEQMKQTKLHKSKQ